MKRLIIGLGIAAMLTNAGAANATPFSLRQSGNWNGQGTWAIASSAHPDDGNDTATFSLNANGLIVDVNGSYSYGASTATYSATINFEDVAAYTLTTTSFAVDASSRAVTLTQSEDGHTQGMNELDSGSLTISAGNAGGEHALYLLSAGTLDVHGDIQLNGAAGVDATAEFEFDGASLSSGSLVKFDMNGGDHRNRVAKLNMDASLTVNDTDIDASGFCDIVVADNTTFSVEDFVIATGADVWVIGEDSVNATFKYDSVTINGTGMYTIAGPITVEEYE